MHVWGLTASRRCSALDEAGCLTLSPVSHLSIRADIGQQVRSYRIFDSTVAVLLALPNPESLEPIHRWHMLYCRRHPRGYRNFVLGGHTFQRETCSFEPHSHKVGFF